MDSPEVALCEILPTLVGIHFNKCVLRLHCGPGTVLGSEGTAVNKIAFLPLGLTLVGGTRQ